MGQPRSGRQSTRRKRSHTNKKRTQRKSAKTPHNASELYIRAKHRGPVNLRRFFELGRTRTPKPQNSGNDSALRGGRCCRPRTPVVTVLATRNWLHFA